MKRWKKIALWIGGCGLLLVIFLYLSIMSSIKPTTGPPIAKYSDPRTALLIVDIQEDYTGPQAKKPFRDGNRIVEASNALIAQAQAKGIPVIFIQNVFDNPIIGFLTGGVNAPGAPGTAMDGRLIKVPGAVTFTKNRPDAFANPELDAYLRENRVEQLLITGLDGAYCVNATTHGALNRGYKVTLYRDGIATESGKSIDKLAESWRQSGAHVKSGAQM